MFVLLKILAETREPEFVEDEWNPFRRQRGVAVRNLEVQVGSCGVAGIAHFGQLFTAADLLMQPHADAPLLDTIDCQAE